MKMVALMCALTGALCYMSLHGDTGDSARECRDLPCDIQSEKEERQEREEWNDRNSQFEGGMGCTYYECTHAIEYYMSHQTQIRVPDVSFKLN